MQNPNILPQEIKKHVERVTEENENIKEELQHYQEFINKFNAGNLFHEFKQGKIA